MASNDMNSWDDDPDELLRRHWQGAFDDFEVQPRSSLSRHILNQLPAGRRRRPVRWLAGGLLLLIGVGLLDQVRFSEHPGSASKPISVRSAEHHLSPSSGGAQPTASAKHPTLSKLARTNSRPGEATASQRSTVHQPSAPPMETSGLSTLRVTPPSVKAQADFLAGTKELTKRTSATDQRIAGKALLRGKTRKTLRAAPSGLVRNERSELLEATMSKSAGLHTSLTPQSSINYPSSISALQFIKTAGLPSLPSQLSTLPDKIPPLHSLSRHLAEEIVTHPAQRWFIDAVPLSSFQWMNALPISAVYLSQVHAPAAFSPGTWGYQVNGGIRVGRWQAHLSVGQFRRWAYYTVNENRYRVEPSPANPYHLVRETYTVAENVALPMVGAGLSQYQLLGQGRYAVELGGQVSYLPTSRQTLLGLRGRVGRRLPLNHRMELQAGVLVEYGLNHLLSEQRQLAIHPVVMGLSVRIQSRPKRP